MQTKEVDEITKKHMNILNPTRSVYSVLGSC